jgi:PTH2 family peptidyl-tRNA hydrolase
MSDLNQTAKEFPAKQVIVVRSDLAMSRGKMAAQVAHASLGSILSQMHTEIERSDINDSILSKEMKLTLLKIGMLGARIDRSYLDQWISGRFAKIVVYIDNEEDLLRLINKADSIGVPTTPIYDAGASVFNGQRTLTCAAFGPWKSDIIDSVTSHLKTNVKDKDQIEMLSNPDHLHMNLLRGLPAKLSRNQFLHLAGSIESEDDEFVVISREEYERLKSKDS